MKVCVIGAGPSGLTTIKQLLDEGHQVTCFDKYASIGGIWYRNANDAEQMKVFDNLILTISRKLMAFSDFMIPGERIFFTHKEYLKYLEAYADKFNLRPHISLNSTVENIQKTADGKWGVTVTVNGQRTEAIFEAVAVCSGPFKNPNRNIPDLDKFTGEVVHSYKYRNNQPFAGKKVLVVGLAESGADVVREVSDVASACTLSVRSRSLLLPRLFKGEYSTDMITCRAHHHEMYIRSTNIPYRMKALFGDDPLSRMLFSAVTNAYGTATMVANTITGLLRPRAAAPSAADPNVKNNLGQSLYPKKLDVFTEWTKEHTDIINDWNVKSHQNQGNWSPRIIYSKNVSFIPNIAKGKILVNDSGIEKIDGNRVYFKDKLSDVFDVIVLCTGFIADFSVFGKATSVPENNVRNLYKHSIHPEHDGRLAFMGFTRPFSGGIPVCAEMQARYFALLCSNKLKLPAKLAQVIQAEKAWEETWTSLSPRHTESIPSQVLYLDSIAKEIGCLMSIPELLTKPRLLVRHWFYSFNQSCYRLKGPHSMYDSAVQEILSERLPFDKNSFIWTWARLALLPYFIHPRDFFYDYPDATKRAPVAKPQTLKTAAV